MTGRYEHQITVEKQIENNLKDCPDLLGQFYYSMANKTHNTKRTYISQILLALQSYAETIGKAAKNLTDEDIERIDADYLNQYFTERKREISNGKPISNAIIATQISALTQFFNFVMAKGGIEENPVLKSAKRPSVKGKRKITFLEFDEITEVLENIDHGVGSSRAVSRQSQWRNRDKTLFLLALTTGLRVSALDEINMEDLDINKRTVQVIEKGGIEVERNIVPQVLDSLKIWIEEREKMLAGYKLDALFISKYNGEYCRITTRAIQKIVKKYSASIGKNISPHKLRSTFGTQTYRASGDIQITASLMGHSSVETTMIYAAVDENQAKKAQLEMSDKILSTLHKM